MAGGALVGPVPLWSCGKNYPELRDEIAAHMPEDLVRQFSVE